MAQYPEGPPGSGAQDHGLRFMNEDWNESISNGHPFMLKWNESLEGIPAELGVFKVAYPEHGMVAYELVSNLTGYINIAHCLWRPQNLEDELYTLWLTTTDGIEPSWTISPPWRPREIESKNFHWAAPVGIPIVVILTLYALGVFTCLWYRRRRRAKERIATTARSPPGDAAGSATRYPSVDSDATEQTLAERDSEGGESARRKPESWLFMDEVPRVNVRRPSDSTASMDRASEETVIGGESTWLQPGRLDEVWMNGSRRPKSW